jgi:hypothetical protein
MRLGDEFGSRGCLHTEDHRVSTVKTYLVPSEMVVAHALHAHQPESLLASSTDGELKRLMLDRADWALTPGFDLAA